MGEEVQSLFDGYLVLILVSMIVWQNGHLLHEEEVRISPFDSGLTIGQGVFETMLAIGGKVVSWEKHLNRFKKSVAKLEMDCPQCTELESAMHEVVLANPTCRGQARVRMTLTGTGNLIITSRPVGEPPLTTTAVVVDMPINEKSPTAGLKTLSYGDNFVALAEAAKLGASEALRANTKGELCEAAVSNIFFVKDGVIHTPSLETGCLPGITREAIIEANPGIVEGRWPISILKEADEIWLTNSIRRLQWVSQLGKREFGEPSDLFTTVCKELNRSIDYDCTMQTS